MNNYIIKLKLVKMRGEIDKMIKELSIFEHFHNCPKCESRNIRQMKDKSIFCNRCGYDSRKSKTLVRGLTK